MSQPSTSSSLSLPHLTKGPPLGADRSPRGRVALLITVPGVPVALAVVWILSRYARRVQTTGRFVEPPIYGFVEPMWSVRDALGLVVAVAFVLLSASLMRVDKVSRRIFIVSVVLGALVLAAAVNLGRGTAHVDSPLCTAGYPTCLGTGVDVHVLREQGIRTFVSEFPELDRSIRSPHTRTHPPGSLVAFDVLERSLGAGFLTATALAAAGIATVVATYLMAQQLAGEVAARAVALLMASSPALLLFSYTSMDALYAGALVVSGTMFVIASRRASEPPLLLFVAGALLGLATFLTYAAFFVALAAAIDLTLRSSGWRSAVTSLVPAALGGLGALVVLRLDFGYDLLASYGAMDKGHGVNRPHGYWLVGTPAVYLIYAGVVLAPLGLIALLRGRLPFATALLAALLAFSALPQSLTGLVPGEVERTWLFTLPFFAAAASTTWRDVWPRTAQSPRRQQAVVGAAVALQAGLAIAINARYNTFW